MWFLWSRVECEAAVGSNVRSVPWGTARENRGTGGSGQGKIGAKVVREWVLAPSFLAPLISISKLFKCWPFPGCRLLAS